MDNTMIAYKLKTEELKKSSFLAPAVKLVETSEYVDLYTEELEIEYKKAILEEVLNDRTKTIVVFVRTYRAADPVIIRTIKNLGICIENDAKQNTKKLVISANYSRYELDELYYICNTKLYVDYLNKRETYLIEKEIERLKERSERRINIQNENLVLCEKYNISINDIEKIESIKGKLKVINVLKKNSEDLTLKDIENVSGDNLFCSCIDMEVVSEEF
jgi:hypothetical protein